MTILGSEAHTARFWTYVAKADGCWLWTRGLRDHRYGNFYNGIKDVAAHRYSWVLHNGAIPDGFYVLHRCDNPPCVNPEHLFLGTHAENMQDMMAKGRGNKPCGELVGRAKLTEQAVGDIRGLYASGMTQLAIAEVYGVSKAAVQFIVSRRTWKHIGLEVKP